MTRWSRVPAGLALAFLVSVAARADVADLSEDMPDVVFSPSVSAKALELGGDPVRIYEFVRNELRYESYYGLMKGPDGTLRSGAGNEYDLAALLVSLLRTSQIPAHFVRGRISVTQKQAMDWTGVTNAAAARDYWIKTQPPGWNTVPILQAHLTGTNVERMHIWVEAEIPLARYRGRGGDSSGKAWVALDPSFKPRDWQPDPGLLSGTMPQVHFDYTTPNTGYYQSINSKLPAEIFEDQMRAFVAGMNPPKSLDEIRFAGPIRREAPGIIPTSLPYQVLGDPVAKRHASLIPLHQLPPGTPGIPGIPGGLSPFGAAGTYGAADYRFSWSVYVCSSSSTATVSSCLIPTPGSMSILQWLGQWTAAAEGHRFTLTFPPTSAPASNWQGYTSCLSSPTSTTATMPTIRIDGVAQIVPGATSVPVCTKLNINVVTVPPLAYLAPSLGAAPGYLYTGTAGGTFLFGIDAQSGSRLGTLAAGDRLIRAAGRATSDGQPACDAAVNPTTCFPIAKEGAIPFVDRDRNGVRGANELYLGADFAAQDALVGGLLDLEARRYFELVRDGDQRINALYHRLSGIFPSTGIVSAGVQPAYVLGIPFTVRPELPFLDIKGTGELTLRRDATETGENDEAWELAGHHGSASEHASWEEATGIEAVSTVKGFQIGYSQGASLLVVHSQPEAQQKRIDANCTGPPFSFGTLTSSSVCERSHLMDATTWCALYRRWPAGVTLPDFTPYFQIQLIPTNTPAAWGAFVCGSNTAPALSTAELRIQSNSTFNYRNTWKGYVYYEKANVPGGVSQGFLIVPSSGSAFAGGAFALANYTQTPFLNPNLYDPFLPAYAPAFLTVSKVSQQVHAGDPVSIVTGNYQSTDTDIDIPGRGGFDLRLVRAYNSRSSYDGPLGRGWTHTFDQNVRIDDNGTTADHSDDKVIWLDEGGLETTFFDPTGLTGELTSEIGIHDRLVREADGRFTLTTKAGTVYRFLAPIGAATDPPRGKLSSITDRNGNTLTCTRDAAQVLTSVQDTAGRSLSFSYQSGSLHEIQDWTGRIWRYTVTATSDGKADLTEYRDPVQVALGAAGRGTTYEYYTGQSDPTLNHNLKRVLLPADRTLPDQTTGKVSMTFAYYGDDTVYNHTDSLGEVTYFSYNFFRKRTTVTNPDGTSESFLFDAYGNTVRHESALGVVRQYVYQDGTRDRIREIDGLGQTTFAEYDARGNMKKRTDRTGRVESWSYNPFGQPTEHIDPRQSLQRFEYDAKGNLLRQSATVDGALHLLRENHYDGYGNLTSSTAFSDPSGGGGNTTRFDIDPSTGIGLVRAIDAAGSATRFTLDALGRPLRAEISRTVGDRTAPQPITTATAFDALDRPFAVTDPAGTVRGIEYDANGRIRRRCTLVPAVGHAGLLIGRSSSNVCTVAAPSGARLRVEEANEYDAADRKTKTANALGHTTELGYDLLGRVVRMRSPLGYESRLVYDADGHVVQAIDPTGAVARTEYDAEGRAVRVTDPVGQIVATSYDAEGRVTEQRQEARTGNAFTTLRTLARVVERDAAGAPTKTQDAASYVTKVDYDELGRTRSVTTAFGTVPSQAATTELRYDLAGRVTERIDAEGHSTKLRYDPLGRLGETTDALGRQSSRGYDEAGDLTNVITAAGEQLKLEYDVRGLLLRRHQVGTVSPNVDDEFRYDGFGRQVFARNAAISYSFEYDDLDRALAVQEQNFGTARRLFDADGFVTQAVYPDGLLGYPEGVVVGYQYDARGALSRVSDPVAGVWLFDYDAAGRPLRESGPGGVERTTRYTPEGFVDRIDIAGPAAAHDAFTYGAYDSLGNPGTITTESEPGSTSLVYDANSQIRSVVYPGSAGSELFEYDRVGKRTLHTQSGTARRYVYDAADELVRIEDPGTGSAQETFGYDGAGRRKTQTPTGGATVTYGYDALGRLTSLAKPGYSLGLLYAPTGHRYQRREGAQVSQYLGEWAERRQGVRHRLVHGVGSDAVLAEVAMLTSSGVPQPPQVRQLLRDGSQNVAEVVLTTAPAAPSVESPARRYEAFGRVRAGASVVERGFAGQPTEGTSGLLYFRARHYDPATGTFLQSDPLGIEAAATYAYGRQNPYRFWDPSGLDAQHTPVSGGGIASIAAEAGSIRGGQSREYSTQTAQRSGGSGGLTSAFDAPRDGAPSSQRGEPAYRPAPAELIGTRNYYTWRNENAPSSFRNDAGPNYYLDYGVRKFDDFQRLRSTSSDALKGFIDRSGAELQLSLEQRLQRDPSIELSRRTLLDAAVDTHSDGYRAAGFRDLSYYDRWRVLRTVGVRDLFVDGGLREIWQSRDLIYP